MNLDPRKWFSGKPKAAPALPPTLSHFQLANFACPCCKQVHVEPALISVLETLRALVGHPINISSGYRCPKHNAAIGGAPQSQHLAGRAADIYINGMRGVEIYRLAKTISAFRGFGLAAGWMHLDVRQGPISKWAYNQQGRVCAWPEGQE